MFATLQKAIKLLNPVPEPMPERSFRYYLSQVPTKARLNKERTLLEVRPTNLDDFQKKLTEAGVANDATNEAIKYLKEHPAEYVKFAHG
jgi:hypothetical protein